MSENEAANHDGWVPVTVNVNGGHATYRMRVPGGWLYRETAWFTYSKIDDRVVSVALVFVPDPASVHP